MKLLIADDDPQMVRALRITLAAAVLIPIAWRRGVLRPALAHIRAVAAFAVAELVIPFFLIAFGEQWLTSSLSGILIATVPLTVVVIAPLFGVHERLGAKRIAGLAKLAVSDAALPALTQQFTRILELVSKVQRIDVGGHDPATQSPIGVEDLRNDEPGPTLERRAVSGNAPQHDGAFLVVPKVLGDDEG